MVGANELFVQVVVTSRIMLPLDLGGYVPHSDHLSGPLVVGLGTAHI